MKRVPLSPVRRFVLWWMGEGSSYISSNLVIDFTAAHAYLERVNAQGGPVRVTIQHLVCGIVGRVYQEFPVANRRIVGGRVFQAPSVGLACPVNLMGHEGADHIGETTMMLLGDVDTLSLRAIAEASTKTVKSERSGKITHPVARALFSGVRFMPGPVFRGGLGLIGAFNHSPAMARLSWRITPATAAVTNVGAAYRPIPGALLRGGAYEPPDRLIHMGALWGIGAVQEEVVPMDGKAVIRPMLPVTLVFDHRLFDGVMGARILRAFTQRLMDPASTFGEDGLLPG